MRREEGCPASLGEKVGGGFHKCEHVGGTVAMPQIRTMGVGIGRVRSRPETTSYVKT